MDKIYFPNLILISGTCRNVGKTRLACKIINHFSKNGIKSIGIKISHHKHNIGSEEKIFLKEDDKFLIIEELLIQDKDSSRMKQAGAERTFYIQAEQNNIFTAYITLINLINPINKVIVCESKSLNQYLEPALYYFVLDRETINISSQATPMRKLKIEENGNNVNIDLEKLTFENNIVKIK